MVLAGETVLASEAVLASEVVLASETCAHGYATPHHSSDDPATTVQRASRAWNDRPGEQISHIAKRLPRAKSFNDRYRATPCLIRSGWLVATGGWGIAQRCPRKRRTGASLPGAGNLGLGLPWSKKRTTLGTSTLYSAPQAA